MRQIFLDTETTGLSADNGDRLVEIGLIEMVDRRLTGDNGTHVVSYGTEAGQFQAVGHSTVVCGPGDIAQAHQPDEFLSVAEFEAGWRFMEGVVADLCTRGALA